jgi:hypothetical protein
MEIINSNETKKNEKKNEGEIEKQKETVLTIEVWCGANYVGVRKSSVGELFRMFALCMSKYMRIWTRSIIILEEKRVYFEILIEGEKKLRLKII